MSVSRRSCQSEETEREKTNWPTSISAHDNRPDKYLRGTVAPQSLNATNKYEMPVKVSREKRGNPRLRHS